MLPLRTLAAGLLALTGCLEIAPQPLGDAGQAPANTGVTLRASDFLEQPVALDALPRRPRFELTLPAALVAPEDALLLFAGSLDGALRDDLRSPPIRQQHLERRVPLAIETSDNGVWLWPQQALAAGTAYSLVLVGFALLQRGELAQGLDWPLRVQPGPGAGAAIQSSWPADGSAGVPPNVALLSVATDGDLARMAQAGLWVEDALGQAISGELTQRPCAEVALGKGRCLVLKPDGPLAPQGHYRIQVGALATDARGAPLGPYTTRFTTGTRFDLTPPRLDAPDCLADEVHADPLCILPGENRLRARVAADEPVRFELLTEQARTSATAARGNATLSLGDLQANTPYELELRAVDLAGNTRVARLQARTTAPLPRISIVEVRPDPLGPEPAQEFVELLNYGDREVDLSGFSLTDDAQELGRPFDVPVQVHPGARLLLVADAFDPNDPKDVPPPPGSPLLRVGPSLATKGLSNTGEALFLHDSWGRRISEAPALKARPGRCLVRVSTDMRGAGHGTFVANDELPCSPGR